MRLDEAKLIRELLDICIDDGFLLDALLANMLSEHSLDSEEVKNLIRKLDRSTAIRLDQAPRWMT